MLRYFFRLCFPKHVLRFADYSAELLSVIRNMATCEGREDLLRKCVKLVFGLENFTFLLLRQGGEKMRVYVFYGGVMNVSRTILL